MPHRFINPPAEIMQARNQNIYETPDDTRSPFFRDYCRILHSTAYRRLKHKTQVFYDVSNDHICTRMEHVQHVESVAYSLAQGLGLDVELTRAIAIGHDLGHAPFGHYGEVVLNDLIKDYFSDEYRRTHFGNDDTKLFWHERNGLRFVDSIELLSDPQGVKRNLNLTYAVRDGIISHCGEIDENGLRPREEAIDLNTFDRPGRFMPYTWEGCAVKIADKIAYLGRDIEDAITLGFISEQGMSELKSLARRFTGTETLNTTGIMHSLITDLCKNSSQDEGLTLSQDKLELLNEVKRFNYAYIYGSKDFDVYKDYARLVLTSIFTKLYDAYDDKHTISTLNKRYGTKYRKLTSEFIKWLSTYCVDSMSYDDNPGFNAADLSNEKIYSSLETRDIYCHAIIDFISGMTDAFAIELFGELIAF